MIDDLMRELIRGQKKQTELLRKHLGRLRFSLRALLLLMTVTACGLGYMVYIQRTNSPSPASGTVNLTSGTLLLNNNPVPQYRTPLTAPAQEQ